MNKMRDSFLSKKAEIKELLHQLFSKELTLECIETSKIDQASTYVALYINDHHQIIGCVRLNITLAVVFAILCTDIHPEQIEDISTSGLLTSSQVENLSDIMNILSLLFTWHQNRRVKLCKLVHFDELTDQLQKYVRNTTHCDSFAIQLEELPKGGLHLYPMFHTPIQLSSPTAELSIDDFVECLGSSKSKFKDITPNALKTAQPTPKTGSIELLMAFAAFIGMLVYIYTLV